jgi:hypothetical protein
MRGACPASADRGWTCMKAMGKLRASSDHVWYEIAMFFAAARFLIEGGTAPTPVQNAMIEAFVIHFRNCYDFFFETPSSNDDVAAIHYFPEPSDWKTRRAAASPFLEEQYRRANKEVAHLTYSRQKVSGETKRWDSQRILGELLPIIAAFESALSPELHGPRWKDAGPPSRCGWNWLGPSGSQSGP